MRSFITTVIAALAVTVGISAQAKPRVVTIAASDNLAFSMTAITAKPGETLRVVLSTKSMQPKTTMAHNFVLLAAGTNPDGFAMMAAMARATDYIPVALKDKILVATKMAGNGETVTAEFKAPAKPGQYVYICTFPGHLSGGMRGVLNVR